MLGGILLEKYRRATKRDFVIPDWDMGSWGRKVVVEGLSETERINCGLLVAFVTWSDNGMALVE
jgi:hypothetical protein